MKNRGLSLSLLLLALAGFSAALPAISQTAGLIPTGSTSLPQGQYMLTNLRTGQAVYVEIDPGGRLLAQDPRALQWSVTPANNGYGTPPAVLPSFGNPADTTSDTGQQKQGSMWGGLLRQGVQSIMNNKTQPVVTPSPQQ